MAQLPGLLFRVFFPSWIFILIYIVKTYKAEDGRCLKCNVSFREFKEPLNRGAASNIHPAYVWKSLWRFLEHQMGYKVVIVGRLASPLP